MMKTLFQHPNRRALIRQAGLLGLGAVSLSSLSALGLSTALAQMPLDQARREKLVGEQRDGLLGALVNRPEVIQLVEAINQDRMAAYRDIARAENIAIDQVQAIAAEKIFARLPAGSILMDANGRWVEK